MTHKQVWHALASHLLRCGAFSLKLIWFQFIFSGLQYHVGDWNGSPWARRSTEKVTEQKEVCIHLISFVCWPIHFSILQYSYAPLSFLYSAITVIQSIFLAKPYYAYLYSQQFKLWRFSQFNLLLRYFFAKRVMCFSNFKTVLELLTRHSFFYLL